MVRKLSDSSGKITVGVLEDQTQTSGSKQELTVTVDSDMVAVGGGGIGSPNPGAFLTSSRPNEGFTGWTVASTDHTVVDQHRLQGFALGLKIAGIDRATLLEHIQMDRLQVGAAHHPEISALLDPNFLLISGGFEVIPTDDANLATASYPEFLRGWRSASKDHVQPSPAGIASLAIGIKALVMPPAMGSAPKPLGRIVVDTVTAQSSNSTRPNQQAELDSNFALTGIGALVRGPEPGCLIWKLAPLLDNQGTPTQGVDAAARDHLEPSKNNIQVWAIGIQLQEDPCA